MIITLSGTPGSGKSTVARLLALQLGFKHYSMGDMRRRVAQEHGMTIQEWNRRGEETDETDKPVDDEQKRLGQQEDNFVMDGRLSWLFIPQAFKVFLGVDTQEGARRIFEHAKSGARESEQAHASVKDVVRYNAERTASDNVRYQKYYGVTWDNPANFDLVIDTTDLSPEDVVERILRRVQTDTHTK